MRLSPLVFSSLAFAPALLAQRIPEVEPNGTAATAQAILVGTQIDANLAAGEQDWFSFTLPVNTRIRIHTSNTDTRMALLDASGTTYLGIDDDARTSTNGYSSEITLNIAAGTYTIQVVGFGTTTAGLYSLEVGELTPIVYDGVEVEPNETHLTATPTGVLGSGVKRFHGALGADTLVWSDSAAVPATPPVVLSGAAVASATVFSGSSLVAATANSTTVTQTAPLSQPAANPLLASYTPGMNLLMTSGANTGLARLISSNTAFSVTTAAFPVANASGDTFDIVTTNTTTVTWVASLPLAGLYVGGSGYSLRMTSGANVGLSRAISANTGPSAFGSAITTAAFPVANAPGDTFDIDCVGSSTAFRTTSAMTANVWNPAQGGLALGHFQVRFTSGANAGLVRQINGNTAASITLASALTAAPAAGDTFVVEQVDADYWQVVLTAPYTSLWLQINEGDAPWVFGHRFEIYDAAGNALLPVTSLQLPAFGTQSATASTLVARSSSVRVLPAGTYYIAVRTPPTPFTAATTMPGGVVPYGNYMLELFTMPMDTGSIVTETEPVGGPNGNNTAATAIAIAPGQIGRGNVTVSSGTDASDWWGPIVISTPSTITYQTRRGATATPMLDTTINLRDSAGNIALATTGGNILDVPSTSTTGLHARTTVSFYLTPQTYYIEVISPGTTAATQSGDYELEISSIIAAPYVAASFATAAANGPSCSSVVALSDLAAAGSTTTSIVPTAPLVASAYANGACSVRFTSGANSGLVRAITANTATSITVAAFPVAPTAGDTYQVLGSPTLVRQFASEVPAMGSLFVRQLVGCPPNADYVHMIGFSNTVAGAVPLPIDLTVIGAPGCTLNIDPVLLTIGRVDGTGSADILTQLPPITAFRGFVWYEQAVVNNPTANAFGVGLSNWGRVITGERTY